MPRLWSCPRCGRTFRRANQSHSCRVGSREALLHGKPEPLVKLYLELERTLQGWRGVEIGAHGRYALFRTTRVFADLVFMSDALRLAVLLDREVKKPFFFKIGRLSAHRVAHVAKLRNKDELRAVKPYLEEAYRFATGEPSRKVGESRGR